RNIDLIEHIGVVRRDNGDAEHLTEPDREDEQPDQRPHQRRDEAFALMQEAQAFAPDDTAKADGVLRERKAARGGGGDGAHAAALAPGWSIFVRRAKAPRMSVAPVSAISRGANACARMRP